MSLKPCIQCGEPSSETRCIEHRIEHATAKDEHRGNRHARGYTSAWDRLSIKARKLQPFCLDCGTTTSLTTDHLPSAWARIAEGKPLRLTDVEVVCNDCNAARGSSRPGSDRFDRWAAEGGAMHPSDPSEYHRGRPRIRYTPEGVS